MKKYNEDPVQLKKIIKQHEVQHTSHVKLDVFDFPEGQYLVQFVPVNNSERIFYTGTFFKVD